MLELHSSWILVVLCVHMYMYVYIYVQYMHIHWYHMNTHLPSPTLAICCRYVVFHKLQLRRTLNLLLRCPVLITLIYMNCVFQSG